MPVVARDQGRPVAHSKSAVCAQVWDQTFAEELGPMPHVIHGPCCAEFIVSRERIEAHPR